MRNRAARTIGAVCGWAVCVAALAVGPAEAVDGEKLVATIRALPAKRAAYADIAHQRGLMEAEAWLVEQLKGMGYEPELQTAPFFGQRAREGAEGVFEASFNNIIVEIRGQGLPGEVLIFGAHFDAVPGSPGADDNASGAAALLEMARVLRGSAMKRTVRLIFFNLEECGLVGSRAYAEEVLQPRLEAGEERVLGMVSIDGAGYFTDAPNSQTWPELGLPGVKLPRVGNFIAVGGLLAGRPFSQPLIRAMREHGDGLEVFAGDVIPAPVPDFLRSDHAPFLLLGIPAVIATTTANFRNPHYHRKSDTLETLDVERMTKAARALTGAAYRLAWPVDEEEDVMEAAGRAPAERVGEGRP